MSHVRDLPPVSGSIIWAKQIDRQLTAYMRRVEDVLGKGWESHVEGQKLKGDGDSFRLKLNTQEIFDDWARKVSKGLHHIDSCSDWRYRLNCMVLTCIKIYFFTFH